MAKAWRWIVLSSASIGGLILFRLLNRLEVINPPENRRPGSLPRIYYANHPSWFDPLVILFGCLTRPVGCLLGTNPRVWSVAYAGQLRGWKQCLIQPARVITHENWLPDIDVKLTAVLDRGDDLLLFPEGRRHRGRDYTDLAAFRKGLVWIARNRVAEIIPVAVRGTDLLLPPGARLPRIGKGLRVSFGEPVSSKTFYGKNAKEITVELEARLRALLKATT